MSRKPDEPRLYQIMLSFSSTASLLICYYDIYIYIYILYSIALSHNVICYILIYHIILHYTILYSSI